MEEVRESLRHLAACWEVLQGQITDKDARLEKAVEFQTLYQTALANISEWLDDVEQRLFVSASWNEDSESRLRDTEALQQEIAALQAEIGVMNKSSQQLMAEAGAGSRELIRQAVTDLNERLRLLEQQARENEQHLQLRSCEQRSLEEQAHDVTSRMAGE